MPATAAMLRNIANAALDYYERDGGMIEQNRQARPMYDAFYRQKKKFPGGQGEIRFNVSGNYVTKFQGYEYNDKVGYKNPTKLKQAAIPWKELHAGIDMSLTELKHDGITFTDTSDASGEPVRLTGREQTAISSIMEDKMTDLSEGSARDFAEILILDGSTDAKKPIGLTAFLPLNPSVGVIEGIDRAANPWWRPRAVTSLYSSYDPTSPGAIAANATNQTATRILRAEMRQLSRYGSKPTAAYAGADALEALEVEITDKVTYSEEGFFKQKNELGSFDVFMRGVGKIMYDPTLDDLDLSDNLFLVDHSRIKLYCMDGEDMKRHYPARQADEYVLQIGLTWTGALVARKMNSSGRYQITKP